MISSNLFSSVRQIRDRPKRLPRVLIDATFVTREKAGVGVYAFNLLRELAGAELPFDVYALVQDDDPDMFLDGGRLTTIRVPSGFCRKLPIRMAAEQVCLPALLSALKIDVLHSLHYSFPLIPTAAYKVVTLHDMISFRMPEVHLRIKVGYFRTFIRAAARLADHLVFDSHSARADFDAILGSTATAGSVAQLGKDDRFCANMSKDAIERTKEKYGLPRQYVLYIGTLEPRKNLVRLVKAFQSIAEEHSGVSLVIAGKKGWMYEDLFELVRSAKLANRVIFTGFVAEADKPGLIAGATVFAYPSLYEGFGIPVLEALSCGVPVITSNISSLPEVAGDSAILINPTDVSEIAKALDLLLRDESLRSRLREKAIGQASRFSWRNTAKETAAIYESCLQGLKLPVSSETAIRVDQSF